MARTVYHVAPYDGDNERADWAVEKEGANRISSKHYKKSSAVQAARNLAKDRKPSQIKIHGEDGSIQNEHTYGDDPERYPS